MQKYLRVLGRGLAGSDAPPAAIRKGTFVDGGAWQLFSQVLIDF